MTRIGTSTMSLNKNKNSIAKVSELEKNSTDGKFLGVCFKILLNYMQMIGIVSSFDMKWPLYTRSFFSIQSGVGNISTQLFSIDCFAKRIYYTYL